MKSTFRQNRSSQFRWFPHTAQSFARAKAEGKLVLVDLDAEWCFWCRKMEQETYFHPEVKAYILKHFIPIRVDADREPELRARYLKRGFPGYAVLTPDRRILFRGSGFLVAKDFLDLLRDIRAGKLNEQSEWADEMALRRELEMEEKSQQARLSRVPETFARELKSRFDHQHAGFLTEGYAAEEAAKYPLGRTLIFLLTYSRRAHDPAVRVMTRKSLNAVLEHLWDAQGGGFYRYAERTDWSVPHTEKVLRTQVRMLYTLALAYQLFKENHYQNWYLKTRQYLFQRLFEASSGKIYGFERAHGGGVARTVFVDQASEAVCTFFRLSKLTGDATLAETAQKALAFLKSHLFSEKKGLSHYFENGRALGEASFADYAWYLAALSASMPFTGNEAISADIARVLDAVSTRFQDQLRQPQALSPTWIIMRVHFHLFRITGNEKHLQQARELAERLLPLLETSSEYAFQDALHLEAKAGYALGIMELQEA